MPVRLSKEEFEKRYGGYTQPTPASQGGSLKASAYSLLGKVGDILSRGQYASASFAKTALEGGNLSSSLKSAYSGLLGKQKTSYSDVLDKIGWKAGGSMANKVTRGLVSTGLDIGLDPTTYLTFGTGAGAKLASKGGITVLSKQGTKNFAKLATTVGRDLAEKEFNKLLEESPEMALKYIDKGGMKFAGITVPGTTALNVVANPINKGLSKVVYKPIDKLVDKIIGQPLTKGINKFANIKEVKALTEKITGAFDKYAQIRDNPLMKRTVQSNLDKMSGDLMRLDRTVEEKLGKYSKQELENVGQALWRRDTSTLTPRELEINKVIQDLFGEGFTQEEIRGLTKGMVEGDYLTQMYKNPEVLEKLKKNPKFAKEGLSVFDPFTKSRQINTLEQAKALGLEPIYNVKDIVKARLAHSIKTTSRYDMLEEIAQLTGQKTKITVKDTVVDKAAKYKNERMIAKAERAAAKASEIKGEMAVKTKKLYGSTQAIQEERTTIKNFRSEMRKSNPEMTNAQIRGEYNKYKTEVNKIKELYKKDAARAKKELAKLDAKLGIVSKNINPKLLDETKIVSKVKTNPELGEDMVKASSYVGFSKLPNADNISIPRNVAEFVERLDPKSPIDRNSAAGKLLAAYDKYTQIFKQNVLTLFPAYHARNFKGNIFQNIMEYGVTDAINPRFHLNALDVMRSKDLGKKVMVGGNEYTVGELRKLMEDNGILQGKGFFELANVSDTKNQNALFRGAQALGRGIENEARAASFLMGLEQSGDVLTAAERTKKALFDYDNLSETEKQVFKRIFPFYTWTRKATANVIETLFKRPGDLAKIYKIVNSYSQFTEPISEAERNSLPDYLKNQFVFKIKKKDGTYAYKSGWGTPLEAVADLMGDPMDNAKFSMNPAIKLFYGILTGNDIDDKTGKKISEITTKNAQVFKYAPRWLKDKVGYSEVDAKNGEGEQYKQYSANPYFLYILRQPPFSRYTGTLGTATSEGQKTAGEKWMQLVFGVNTHKVDIESQMNELEKKYKNELTAPFVAKGLIKKSDSGTYYIPSNLELTPAQELAVRQVLQATKNVNFNINEYLPSSIPTPVKGKVVSTPKYTKTLSREAGVKKEQSAKSGKKSKYATVKDIASRITGF